MTMTPVRRTVGAAAVLSMLCLLPAGGCKEKKRTEIILGVATDLDAPVPLKSVSLQVFRLPQNVPLASQELGISGTIDDLYELPGTFAVYSSNGTADRIQVKLTGVSQSGGTQGTLVVRTAVLNLVPDRTLFVRLGVVTACIGKLDCGDGLTCIDGQCLPEAIDSSRLPTYEPGMETQMACASSVSYVNTSTKRPLPISATSCTGGATCVEGYCLAPARAGGGGAGGGPGNGTGGAGGRGAGGRGGAPGGPGGGAGGVGGAPSLGRAVGVSVAAQSACAVTSAGGVVCWGDNGAGALGDGSTIDSPTPVAVTGLSTGVTALSESGDNVCVLVSGQGGARCWGNNQMGALGNGTTTNSSVPVPVSGLSSIMAVSEGGTHGCALTTSGGVLCWGRNEFGQLGDGSMTDSSVPVPVVGLSTGVTAVSVGSVSSCALTSGGAVSCWGFNGEGELGNSSVVRSSPMPVPVMGLASGVTAVSVGTFSACALTAVGGVVCWGDNSRGTLGNGSTTSTFMPVPVTGLASGVTKVSVGTYTVCALTAEGAVLCWGNNAFGQLGNNSTTSSTVPVAVTGLGSGVVAVSTGESSGGVSCAVTTAGAVLCWGFNGYGALGNNSLTDSSVPVRVVGFP